MKNVKLVVAKRSNINSTIGIAQLIGAVAVTADRSIEDVTNMMEQDGLLPRSGLPSGPMLDLQRSYWREGDWFDDALKYVMLYNRVSKLIILETDE